MQLADNEIENARKLYALLVDDERRIAVTETLGKAIDAKAIDAGKGHPIPEALIDVMAEALGVTDNDEDPTESADRLAATEDESEEWRIKYKKISWGLVLECHARQPQTKQRGHAAIRDAGRGGGRRARGDRA